MTPGELAFLRALQVARQAPAKRAAEAKARAAMLQKLHAPALLMKIAKAKVAGELTESPNVPGLWRMNNLTGRDAARLFVHAKTGVIIKEDGSTAIDLSRRGRR